MKMRWLDYLIGVPLIRFLRLFAKKTASSSGIPKKILIIKLAAAGDTVLLLPVIHSLKKALPDTAVHWLVSSINIDLAKHAAEVERLFLWDRKSFLSLFAVVRALRREKYDVVIDFEQWGRGTALIAFFTGALRRIGFNTPGQRRAGLFTDSIPKTYARHEIKDFYGLARFIVPMSDDLTPVIIPPPEAEAALDVLLGRKNPLKEDRFKVVLHPGCGADGWPREWPLGKYAVLAHWLLKQYGAIIFLTGGPEERKKTSDLNRLLNGQAIDLGGRLSWNATIALLSKVDLVVSGNTGVMHLAAALGRNQVALHGPTSPVIWGPLNNQAQNVQTSCPECPCLRLGFEYHTTTQSCMEKIEVEDVKMAVSALI